MTTHPALHELNARSSMDFRLHGGLACRWTAPSVFMSGGRGAHTTVQVQMNRITFWA